MADGAVQQKQQAKTPAAPGVEPPPDTVATQDLQDPTELVLSAAAPEAEVAAGGGDGGGGGGKKLSWREALGKFLGDKLYDGLAPALSEEKLQKYANDAWNDAVAKAAEWIKGQATTPDETQIASKLTTELQKGLKDKVGPLINFDLTNVAEGVADFARKNPELVILAALAGAAAYVATNQPIPALKQSLGLGKAGKLDVGAKFTGGFLDLFKSIDQTIEQLSLAYKVGGFQADASYEHKDGHRDIEGGAGYTLKDSYTNDKGEKVDFTRLHVAGNGGVRLNDAGDVKGYKFGGDANLNLGDRGQHQLSAGGNFQSINGPNGPKTEANANLGYKYGNWSANANGQHTTGPAGANTQLNVAGGYTSPNLSLTGNAGYQSGPNGSLGTLGVQGQYKNGGLNLQGNGMVGTDGRFDVNGKVAADLGDGWSLNGNAGVSRLPGAGGPNAAFDNKFNVGGGVEYKKGNTFFNMGGGYQNVNGQGSGTLNIGAGIRF